MYARTVQEDRARHQRGCAHLYPVAEGHPRVRAIKQCAQESRDALCAPEGPAWLRAHAPSGLTGARDEFHLPAIVQNLKTMALRLLGPPTGRVCASIA